MPIIVVVGQTATGKSDIAVRLAKDLEGEIVSADSRQVYKEFNLTSGKISKEEMQGVKHHLLDVLSVKTRIFDAADFKKRAQKALLQIHKKRKLPIIAGGTAFYIDVLLDRVKLEPYEKDAKLRSCLDKRSKEELFAELLKLNKEKAAKIDKNNKRRLIRALEIEIQKKRDSRTEIPLEDEEIKFCPVWIGLRWDKETLRYRIKKRLFDRYKKGMCKEVKHALECGVSKKRIESLGLEFKYCLYLIEGKLTEKEFLETLENKIWQFAKRQATYWKKNKDIKWFSPSDYEKILQYTKKQLKNCDLF